MNIQRFVAPTSREALAKARLAFDDATLILSNRPTASGIEVVATAEDTLAALDAAATKEGGAARATPPARGKPIVVHAKADNAAGDDARDLAMSTLSFQDYVRERMLRRRAEARGEQQPMQRHAMEPVFDEAPPAKRMAPMAQAPAQ